jgi:hypothetical protein
MRRVAALAVAAVAVLAACSPDQSDYKRETEQFIKGDERVATATRTTFTKAECEPPQDTKVGSRYSCVAVAADGSTWDFAAEITAKNRFEVIDYKART